MISLLDIKLEKAKYDRNKKIMTNAMIGSIVLFTISLTLAIIFSPKDYALTQWIAIFVTTLYIWVLLYVNSVPLRRIRQYRRFYENASDEALDEMTVTITSYSRKWLINPKGLEVQVLVTSYDEKDKTYERWFYILADCPEINVNTKVKIQSFNDVVVAYEVLNHE